MIDRDERLRALLDLDIARETDVARFTQTAMARWRRDMVWRPAAALAACALIGAAIGFSAVRTLETDTRAEAALSDALSFWDEG